MEKVIIPIEEWQAEDMRYDILWVESRALVARWKAKGYIKKSTLEDVSEIYYKNMRNGKTHVEKGEVKKIKDLYEKAIEELQDDK